MGNSDPAMWGEPAEGGREEWAAWLASRPDNVRAVAERFNPWQVYRLRTTGQACRFLGCDVGAQTCGEPNPPPDRVTARIYAQHPGLGEISAVQVFGIDPDDIEPWPPGEPFTPADPMRARVSVPFHTQLGGGRRLADYQQSRDVTPADSEAYRTIAATYGAPSRSEFSQLPAADPGRNNVSRPADYRDLVLAVEPPEEAAARRRIVAGLLERLRSASRYDLGAILPLARHEDRPTIAVLKDNRVGHVGVIAAGARPWSPPPWLDTPPPLPPQVVVVPCDGRSSRPARDAAERSLRRDLKRAKRRAERRRARILLSIRRHPERWPAALVRVVGLKLDGVVVKVTGIDPGKGRKRPIVVEWIATMPPATDWVVLDSVVGGQLDGPTTADLDAFGELVPGLPRHRGGR